MQSQPQKCRLPRALSSVLRSGRKTLKKCEMGKMTMVLRPPYNFITDRRCCHDTDACEELQENPVVKRQFVRAAEAGHGVKFAKNNEFQAELRRRVDEFFENTGLRQRDLPQMYLKTVILLVTFAAFYVLLVFAAHVVGGIALAILLGLAAAGIGFNIQHDGGHQAYSDHPWVNKLMSLTLDLIGGSSSSGTISMACITTLTSTSRMKTLISTGDARANDAASKAVLVSPVATPLHLAALRSVCDQMASV